MPVPQHILVVHESYRQRGGEDRVVASEVELLKRMGHRVSELRRNNDELEAVGVTRLMRETFWSDRTSRELARIHAAESVDLVHVHNTVPLISPSVYWAAHRSRIPVVQTLHNFRLICPQAMLLRRGAICEDCVGRQPWRGALRGCYRGSVAQSTAIAAMLSVHRGIGTWQRRIHRYVALNEFCRRKFIEGGLPPDRITVKPNFVLDSSHPVNSAPRRDFLYVGRLSSEKGIETLVRAIPLVRDGCVRIQGSGPSLAELQNLGKRVQLLGEQTPEAVRTAMEEALALVLPSIWYENFPMVLVEAFAAGLPVIASRIGALAETIEDGVTGLLFEPGNDAQLAERMNWAICHPEEMAVMGREARARFDRLYAAPANYRMLTSIYEQAVQVCKDD